MCGYHRLGQYLARGMCRRSRLDCGDYRAGYAKQRQSRSAYKRDHELLFPVSGTLAASPTGYSCGAVSVIAWRYTVSHGGAPGPP